MRMRRVVEHALARHPGLYRWVLRRFGQAGAEKKLYVALLEAGDVIFDIGANEGYFTLLFSDMAGPSGHVHAFEPVPPTFERLSRRVREQCWYDNVSLQQIACGDVDRQAVVYQPGTDGGQSSLRKHEDGSWRHCEDVREHAVEVVRLDRYVDVRAVTKVDFVKCDVEGAELGVLVGMADTLRRHRPLLSLEASEIWMRPFGYDLSRLVTFLQSVGYDGFQWVGPAMTSTPPPMVAPTALGQLLCSNAQVHVPRLQRLGLV